MSTFSYRINRNIMEFKVIYSDFSCIVLSGINRNIMEFKVLIAILVVALVSELIET